MTSKSSQHGSTRTLRCESGSPGTDAGSRSVPRTSRRRGLHPRGSRTGQGLQLGRSHAPRWRGAGALNGCHSLYGGRQPSAWPALQTQNSCLSGVGHHHPAAPALLDGFGNEGHGSALRDGWLLGGLPSSRCRSEAGCRTLARRRAEEQLRLLAGLSASRTSFPAAPSVVLPITFDQKSASFSGSTQSRTRPSLAALSQAWRSSRRPGTRRRRTRRRRRRRRRVQARSGRRRPA